VPGNGLSTVSLSFTEFLINSQKYDRLGWTGQITPTGGIVGGA
jgi:hypothetical protein